MKPRPPGTALFPYTTLFRSRAKGQALVGVAAEAPVQPHGPLRGRLQALGQHRERHTPGRMQVDHALDIGPDRKSTRLNSSHLGNSYAVFCLKKKIRSTERSC